VAGSYDREQLRGAAKEQRLLDYLFQHPVLSVRMAQKHLHCSYNTANSAVRRSERLRILRESHRAGAQQVVPVRAVPRPFQSTDPETPG